jgi:hypothetical protein
MISAGGLGNVAITVASPPPNGMPHETVTSDKKFPLGRDFYFAASLALKGCCPSLLHASNGPAIPRLCEPLHIGFG